MTVHDYHLVRLATAAGLLALALSVYVAWAVTPVQGDLTVIRAAQDVAPILRAEYWINILGTLQVQGSVVALAVLLAVFGPRLGIVAPSPHHGHAAWALVAALGLRVANYPMKLLVSAERPSAGYQLRVTEDFPGYGFPSGHVYSDVLIFGTIAFFAPAIFGRTAGNAVRVICLAVILVAGPARMVVGAHWPSDVLGGFLWGVVALCIAVVAGRRIASRLATTPLGAAAPLT